jgi:hypothetical protein
MKKFTRNLTLLSSILLILIICWNRFLSENLNSPHAVYIVIYFFLLTFVIHHFLIKANTQSPQNFVRSYMLFTALKLFLNLMVIVIYLLIDRKQAMVFILSFLIFYFVFLIFEIIALQSTLKEK